MGKPSSRDQREEGGRGWDMHFSGSLLAVTLGQLGSLGKGHWPSPGGLLYTTLHSGLVNTSLLYSYGSRKATGP